MMPPTGKLEVDSIMKNHLVLAYSDLVSNRASQGIFNKCFSQKNKLIKIEDL